MRVFLSLLLISLSFAFCQKQKRRSLIGFLVSVREGSLVVVDGGRRYEFQLSDFTVFQAGCHRVSRHGLRPGDELQVNFVRTAEGLFARRVSLRGRVSDCCHDV